MIVMIFILGALVGVLAGGALCVRYLRHEVAGDIGPRLKQIQGKLDNLELEINLALVTRLEEISRLRPPSQKLPRDT